MLQTISSLEKDIAGLKKEIGERDETIGDKEKRIYDLKKKNQVSCCSHVPSWHALHSVAAVSCTASACPALPSSALPCPALSCPALTCLPCQEAPTLKYKFDFDCCIDPVSIANPTADYTGGICLPSI